MSKPKRENMMNVSARSSTVFSPPLCCLQMEVLGVKPPLLQTCQVSLIRSETHALILMQSHSWIVVLKYYFIWDLTAVIHLTTVRGARWISPSSHLEDSQCNSAVTKTLSSRVLFLLFICSTSFLYIFFLLHYSEHCITTFTLYTGINVWPCQAWLNVFPTLIIASFPGHSHLQYLMQTSLAIPLLLSSPLLHQVSTAQSCERCQWNRLQNTSGVSPYPYTSLMHWHICCG